MEYGCFGMVSAVALAPVCASPAGAPVPGSDPPGWADARMARRLARADRAASVSVERPALTAAPDRRGWIRCASLLFNFIGPPHLNRNPARARKRHKDRARRAEAGRGARPYAVKPSHPQRLAQLLHTTSYMVPGGCACGQRFLTTHVGQTLEQAALRMTR